MIDLANRALLGDPDFKPEDYHFYLEKKLWTINRQMSGLEFLFENFGDSGVQIEAEEVQSCSAILSSIRFEVEKCYAAISNKEANKKNWRPHE